MGSQAWQKNAPSTENPIAINYRDSFALLLTSQATGVNTNATHFPLHFTTQRKYYVHGTLIPWVHKHDGAWRQTWPKP
jgi:hypothetical protein